MILWQRLDWPGHDAAAITQQRNRWNLAGTALFVMNEQPCRLDYEVECDMHWGTRDVSIHGEVGGAPASLVLSRSPDGEWIVDDRPFPEAQGCADVDLGFSPSTNSLPIRRLKLAVGESAPVRTAWVKFPQLTVEVLDQTYTRLSEWVYLYESAGGAFKRELTVNDDGFVVNYPGLWRAEGCAD
ncbi:MAG: putative glycolipid-binding domain-containing protein [Gemmatimonadota bacterium]|nr:putative glycolipid-binding domain-containing protein [Gemmatimonadota bacterium]